MDLTEQPRTVFRRHPWETVRAEFFRDVLRPVLDLQPRCSMLDVGAGDAFFAANLLEDWRELRITCFDPGYENRPIQSLADEVPSVTFSADEPAEQFDVLTLLDVIEHVEDDAAVLRHLVEERLRPGGHLLFSVPAWPQLFCNHDRQLKHFRRYSPRTASGLLQRCGLQQIRHGGLFHTPLVFRTVAVLRERRCPPRIELPPPRPLEWRRSEAERTLAQAVLSADVRLSRLASTISLGIPGLSWWSLCRRP